MRYLIAALSVVLVAGCSDDSEPVSEERQEAGEELADALAEVPECSEVPSPVDQSVLETGCFEGDEILFGGTYDCEDGTVVVLAGGTWAGVEGGEWQALDPETEGAWDLCP